MAEKNRYRFKGHESFILREGWLNKGLFSIAENPRVFSENYGADELGVGPNMAKAIRYWLRAMNLTEDRPKEGTFLTELGQLICQKDPYLEDVFTIWILHCEMVKNVSQATTWSLFFNRFSYEEFTKKQLLDEMTELAEAYTEGEKFSEKSVEDDCDAILRMYVKRKEKQSSPEEKNKSPFWKLELIRMTAEEYVMQQPDLNHVPEEIVYYLLQDLLKEKSSVPIEELLTVTDGPGRIMNLKRTMLMELLERLEEHGKITVNRTAGLNMVYLKERESAITIIRNYYERHGAHYEPFIGIDTD